MADSSVAPAILRPPRALAAGAAPARRLALAFIFVAAVIAGVLGVSINQPYLGLDLRFDTTARGAVVEGAVGPSAAIPRGTLIVEVAGADDRLRLERDDLTGQVDGSFGPFRDFQRFMHRQGRLAAIQREPQVAFIDAGGRSWTVRPDWGRPIGSFGIDFWIGVVVGVVAWLTSAAIFVFRPRETSARYMLLSGFAMLICAPMGVIYSARELALPETAFYLINGVNFLGGSLFSAALLALLFYYPRQLAPRWVGWAIVGVYLAWYAAQAVGWFPDLTFARRFLQMCGIAGCFALSAVHWRLTRRDPVARAALSWFLLSWVVVASAFAGTVLAPQMFGVDTSVIEPYGFLLFLVIYGGLAVGIMRYRLFELGEWWGRIMAWTLGLMLLAGLDMLFLVGLRLSGELSLSLALLICGLAWLPMRGWVAERVLGRRASDDRALFEGVVQIGLTPDAGDQLARWIGVLKTRFDPLRLDVAEGGPQARLEADGLALVTPAVQGLPALRLEYARGGRTLFSPADAARADALAEMLRFVVESRDAYERGVVMERKRIAGDIHDNLGASLLSALHSRDGDRKDRYIRETLADLRSIVTEPAGPEAGLAETLAGSRKEMAERLQVRGVALDWTLGDCASDGVDSKLAQSLRAMLREITNNIVKHAQATAVRVRLTDDGEALVLIVEDDGVGFSRSAVAPGAGLGGLSDRAGRHGGSVAWTPGAGGRGTRVSVRLPIRA